MFSFWKKKKRKVKIKHSVKYIQEKDTFHISGFFNKEKYYSKELWLFSRERDQAIKIAEMEMNQNFDFNIDLPYLIEVLPKDVEGSYDWYFKIRTTYENLSEAKKSSEQIKLIEEGGERFAEYFVRCGRFKNTYKEGLSFYKKDGQSIIIYITTKGNLSLSLNGEPDSPTKIQIDKFQTRSNNFIIKGKLFTRNSVINNVQIVLRGRENAIELVSDKVSLERMELAESLKYGLTRYLYEAEINMAFMNNGNVPEEDIYDLFIKLELHDRVEPKYVRVGRPALRAKLALKDTFIKGENGAAVLNPYYTFKKHNLSYEVYEYPIDTFNYLQKMMRWAWLIRLINWKDDTWIVGERTYKAQDTGLAFFKYMREKHPDKKVYYIIDKNSPEKRNVEGYGNVIDFKSKEHILRTILAKKVISSHHPDYLYPLRTQKFKNKVKADKVFLQHGVMGTKNMVANYGKKAPAFDTDLFMVSSDFEKSMIVNDFGYQPEEVFVTGLSRFDTLFKKDVPLKRQVLIIPTWRDWIGNEDVFFESEYYARYQSLVNNVKLRKQAEEQNFTILFCLHPNMQRFSKHFDVPGIRVINQGEVDVQQLIKESMLMITDYSSVGFDFSFLHKPIIYYQFDRRRFIGKRPSHLDLNNDLPGPICFEEEDVINQLTYYVSTNFVMEPSYATRADKFIKYRDESSSQRIYEVIKKNKGRRHFWEKTNAEVLFQGLFTKYRKSRYYYPSMKLFYNIGRRIIPVDRNLILFESGLGKQFGDSPKNIYDEILKQDLDYKKIWVYNKAHRFADENTKKIKRLSPQYYYYLLRAGYWVNNQNFPAYIRKRPKTIFLQTWHGTPLKKMLHDLEEVHGRKEGYVERVSNAVQNWDYLLSPSEYATKAFRSAFKYKGEMLEVGYPRNDVFYKTERHDVSESVANRLMLDKRKKVILYAPTFRDDQTKGKSKFSFDINLNLHEMQKRLGDEYIVLLRMHVLISNKLVIDEELREFVRNVSGYPDIQELLLLTDILITDYSSVMFDFANTGKPMIFYTYDLENYQNKLRGFYMDLAEEAPGPLVYSTEEIIDSVVNIEQTKESYKNKYKKFQEKYCYLDDGMAAKRVTNKLF
ncbi:CDP-glycerol glycerophosphotransferase family protein [Virgibacillus halodenitrificans]|uniref:CDP-glycerol glycerophosphotransferase family protein n=1 Tax=Virgibacillus halodenitrificans TaxID=1482 RepID=UPI001EEEDC0F|nr:CDP-glycerol glycerophosphotransferase family protein [Virgibacillus halodenitrificans]MCG1028150.1 CDP-glycerol glycerophosphotransferase family protein [Virgibacillus halodenitrificans]